jgi:hypothetical protein
VRHLTQKKFGDRREEDEAPLKDIRVKQADVRACFGFAQFLKNNRNKICTYL